MQLYAFAGDKIFPRRRKAKDKPTIAGFIGKIAKVFKKAKVEEHADEFLEAFGEK